MVLFTTYVAKNKKISDDMRVGSIAVVDIFCSIMVLVQMLSGA